MAFSLTRARRTMIAVSATALVLTLSGPAYGGTTTSTVDQIGPPPPDRIVIDVVTVIGSGCKKGTTAVAVSPDNTAFTVTYSDYLAQVGVGSKPTDFRKNCQLNLRVHVPGGFTYAVAQADYRGFASLKKGAYAEEQAGYYFAGTSPTAQIKHKINGAKEDSWQTTDSVDYAALVWHPCGQWRNLNINTEIRAFAGKSDPKKTTSFITMDSTDGAINTIYHFAWKKC